VDTKSRNFSLSGA